MNEKKQRQWERFRAWGPWRFGVVWTLFAVGMSTILYLLLDIALLGDAFRWSLIVRGTFSGIVIGLVYSFISWNSNQKAYRASRRADTPQTESHQE
jgi:hypothetical protein